MSDCVGLRLQRLRFRGTLNPKLSHSRPQHARSESEHLRRACDAFDAPPDGFEDELNMIALDVDERPRAAGRRARGRLDLHRFADEGGEIEHIVRNDDRLLEHVLQLADIARPVIALERLIGPGVMCAAGLPSSRPRRSTRCFTRAGRSSRRSRSVGSVIGKTLRR